MRTNILVVISLWLFSLAHSVQGQNNGKTTVGIYPIGFTPKIDGIYPPTIMGRISDRMNCFTQVEILNKIVFTSVKQVHEDAKSWMSSLAETVEQGYIKGPKLLVTGFISNIEENYSPETKTHTVSLIMEVHIIDARSGVSKENRQFIINGSNPVAALLTDTPGASVVEMLGLNNRNKTIENALKSLEYQLLPFLENEFGRNSCVSPKSSIYQPIYADTENTIFIKIDGERQKWIKKVTTFEFVEDEAIYGREQELLGHKTNLIATARFIGYNGDFAVLQLTRKYKNQAIKIMEWINNGKGIYIKRKDKGSAKK